MKKCLAILLTMALAIGVMMPALAESGVQIPRAETLAYNGLSWGTASSFNPLESGGNVGMGIGLGRYLIYEALYMYNMLTGENEPFLAASAPVLSEDGSYFTITLKDNVHFNDGEPLTAEDVVFSFSVYDTAQFEGIVVQLGDVWSYVASVEAVDDYTVNIHMNMDNYNPLIVQTYFAQAPIIPEHIWAPRWEEHGPAMTTLYNEDTVGTGPYKYFLADDARQILIRDDNYWGQAENMFGKLAEPKYIMHELYQNNDAGNIAFGDGRVDISQQFLPSVWEYQEKMVDENGETLVHTYFSEAPYQLGWGMPSLIFSLEKPGLSDYTVRKALALCLDYEAIGTNAMSSYTEDMVMSLFNTYIFGDYIDMEDEELQAMLWDTTDLDGNIALANELLDEAGYLDVDGDGIRELPDGSKYEWSAECPAGWSDWNASLEILVEGAQKIGLNVVTYFPEAATYFNDYYYGTFDIAMWSITPAPSVACPWQAAFNPLYSKGVTPIGEYFTRNTNRFKNDRVDELIELAMTETDEDLLVEYFSEINKIWLSELPTAPLMYRPFVFQTTYGYYWTGFASGDGETTIPPLLCMDAAGIRELYLLTSTGRE